MMDSALSHERSTIFDRILTPVHRWIWSDTDRRVQKLLRFGETETDGGRDILRAAVADEDVSTIFMMIVAGRLSVRRKDQVPNILG